jgi:hypothetical protein
MSIIGQDGILVMVIPPLRFASQVQWPSFAPGAARIKSGF